MSGIRGFQRFVQLCLERSRNLCSSKISVHFCNVLNCLLNSVLSVFLTLRKELLTTTSERHHIKITVLRQTLQKDDQSFFRLINPCPFHRTTPVQQKDVFRLNFAHRYRELLLFLEIFVSNFFSEMEESRHKRHNCMSISICLPQKHWRLLHVLERIVNNKIFVRQHLLLLNLNFSSLASGNRIYFMSVRKNLFNCLARLNSHRQIPET